MVRFGIQASHEQINPADLLNDVIAMDRLGIERCWSSDHYMPWWHTAAAGGAAWPWLGAALARTQKITIGTGVTAPILRYHPAVVAQVFATLDYMFPGRVFLGIGRGESLNEVPAGNSWPSNQERFERMREAIQLIKRLWAEDWVTFEGKYYQVKDSNLYTKPKQQIPIYVAGLGAQSARLAGQETDGFVTNELDPEIIEGRLLPAFGEGAKESGRDPDSLTKAVFIPASYDEDKQKALESIGYWKGAMIKAFFEVHFPNPRKIEENGQVVGNDVLDKMALVVSSADEAIKKLEKFVRLGFTDVVLINSSPNRESFLRLVTEEIAPAFKDRNRPRAAQAASAAM
jgi:coenzyme F420-dependent glucose-6-phosphate dehydrogenase